MSSLRGYFPIYSVHRCWHFARGMWNPPSTKSRIFFSVCRKEKDHKFLMRGPGNCHVTRSTRSLARFRFVKFVPSFRRITGKREKPRQKETLDKIRGRQKKKEGGGEGEAKYRATQNFIRFEVGTPPHYDGVILLTSPLILSSMRLCASGAAFKASFILLLSCLCNSSGVNGSLLSTRPAPTSPTMA